jgi:iron complex outermembrane recepter protein
MDPVAGVYVFCGKTVVSVSGSNGELLISDDVDCKTITLSHIGYAALTIDIEILDYNGTILLKPRKSELEEIVVTATPFHRNIGAIPGSIALISAKELHSGSQSDIRPHLDQIPGIQMQSGALNTARLTIRGIGSRTPYASNRIKAYFDDIPLTSGDGATIVEDLEIAEIGRIEIVKGPSSALYGPGLGGTIIIRPSATMSGWNTFILGETGSFNHSRLGASLSNRQESDFIDVSIYRTKTDGSRENSQYKRTNFIVKGGTKWKKNTFTVLLNHVDLFAQIPSSIDYNTFVKSPSSAASNWLAVKGFQRYEKWQTGIAVDSELSRTWRNKLAVYGIYNNAFESRPFNFLDELTHTAGLRNQLQRTTARSSLLMGIELFSESYEWKIFETNQGQQGDLLLNNKEQRNFVNMFFHYEVNVFENLIVSTGANVHQLFYRTSDVLEEGNNSQSHEYPLVVSPRLGINYKSGSNTYLFVSTAHGFSAPSPEEALLPDGTVNRDLKPEEGYNLDGGIRTSAMNGRINLDMTLYHIWIRNLLMTRRDAEDVFYGENAGRTIHRGIESKIRYNILPVNKMHPVMMSLTVSHTLMDNKFRRFSRDDIDFGGKQLPGLPTSILNTALLLEHRNGFSTRLNVYHTNSQHLDDGNSLKYRGYELVELYANYRIQLFNSAVVELSGGVRNLFDRNYASMVLVNAPSFGNAPPRFYYPGMPRNYFIGLKFVPLLN